MPIIQERTINMAAVTDKTPDTAQEIQLILECKLLKQTHGHMNNIINSNRKLVSGNSALDLELDINEAQEFLAMCTRPLVSDALKMFVVQIETIKKNSVRTSS